MTFTSETGTVTVDELPTGELYVHSLEGDASLFLKAKKYCHKFPGRDVVATIDFSNTAMFDALRSAGLKPDQIIFRGKS